METHQNQLYEIWYKSQWPPFRPGLVKLAYRSRSLHFLHKGTSFEMSTHLYRQETYCIVFCELTFLSKSNLSTVQHSYQQGIQQQYIIYTVSKYAIIVVQQHCKAYYTCSTAQYSTTQIYWHKNVAQNSTVNVVIYNILI